MSESQHKLFELPLQLTVEQLVTDALVAAIQARLPQHWNLAPLKGTKDQKKGDLVLTLGEHRVYIELKAENYSGSLFLEPVQFWANEKGHGIYRRSWAYTTTADFMLYLSTKTGLLMLCPRKPWLESGLALANAYLLSGLDQTKEPYRMSVTLNTKRNARTGVREFTGGAAGTGLNTDAWLRTFHARGHDLNQVVVSDVSTLLNDARAQVRSWSPAELTEYVQSRVPAWMLNKPGVLEQVFTEVGKWANSHAPGETEDTETIRGVLRELGVPAAAPHEELDLLARHLIEPQSPDSGAPILDSMWFLATACLQCGYTQAYGTDSAKLVKQAGATCFEFDPSTLPEGHEVPPGMASLNMRFGEVFSKNGRRPTWEQVESRVQKDAAEQVEEQREYVRRFRHARAAVAS